MRNISDYAGIALAALAGGISGGAALTILDDREPDPWSNGVARPAAKAGRTYRSALLPVPDKAMTKRRRRRLRGREKGQ